jgi:prevent-host-death family protein
MSLETSATRRSFSLTGMIGGSRTELDRTPVYATVAYVLRSVFMSGDVSVRELRNRTAEVLRRVEAGERLRVTVDRRPVAELAPLPARDVWVPRQRVIDSLVQADAALRHDLADVLPDTVDEL